MRCYLLDRPLRRDNKFPLGSTDKHPGCVLVYCLHCGVSGAQSQRFGGKVDIKIEIRDVGYLEDIEGAFTTVLASKKFRDAVTGNRLTGIEFYPPLGYELTTTKKGATEMLRRCRDEFQFQAIFVTGRSGSIEKTSGVKLRKSCAKCGWQEWTLPEQGIFVDETQWDGSDFFYVDEFAAFLMSEKAVDALSRANLSNFGAQPAEDYRVFVPPPEWGLPPPNSLKKYRLNEDDRTLF